MKALDSPLIIGTMRLGAWGVEMNEAELQAYIEGCLEMGLAVFDHADIYGDYSTEQDFGQVLKASPSLREQVKLISKCGIRLPTPARPGQQMKSYDSSAAHIRWSVENSLRALGVEQLDMLLLHRPDYLMQPEEIAEEFTRLEQAGKVASFGVSNFSPSQFELLNKHYPLATNQVEFSILQRQALDDATLDQCMQQNIRPQAWSPLGGGVLFQHPSDETSARLNKACTALENELGCTRDQLLLAWILRHPARVIPVLGSSKLERIRSAKEALAIKLSREQWYMLLEAARGQELA